MSYRFNFVSPGKAAVDELTKELARREHQRRQDFLDSITRNREARTDEIQRAQLDSISEQRNVMNQSRKMEQAKGVAEMMTPTQDLDPETSHTLREGGLGILIRPAGPVIDGETDGTVNTTDVFRGTPGQLKAQDDVQRKRDYLSKLDPNSAEAKALAYEDATGNNAPAGMFAQPPKGAAVTEYEYYVDQETKAGRTPVSFDEYQARDANRKNPPPVRMTDAGFDEKSTARFMTIKSAANRSPLVSAADRTLVLDDIAKKVKANPADRTSQMQLMYGFIQANDTYQSAVREGEIGLVQALHTRWEQLKVEANRLYPQGLMMDPQLAKEMADASIAMISTIKRGRDAKLRDFQATARTAGVGPLWDDYLRNKKELDDAAADAEMAQSIPQSQPQTETPEQRRARLIQHYGQPQK